MCSDEANKTFLLFICECFWCTYCAIAPNCMTHTFFDQQIANERIMQSQRIIHRSKRDYVHLLIDRPNEPGVVL